MKLGTIVLIGLLMISIIGCGGQMPPAEPPQEIEEEVVVENYPTDEDGNDYTKEEKQAEEIEIETVPLINDSAEYVNEES